LEKDGKRLGTLWHQCEDNIKLDLMHGVRIHLFRTGPWTILVNMVMNQRFHKSQEISRPAKLI